MNDPLKNFDKFDDYLLGYLDNLEKEEYEKFLDENPEVKEEVLAQQKIQSAVKIVGRQELKSELKEIHKNLDLEKKEINNTTKYLLWGLVILGLGFGITSLMKQLNKEEIVDEYYAPYEIAMVERGGDTDIQMGQMIGAYRSGNYLESKKLAAQIIKSKEKEELPFAQLYMVLAISDFEMGNLESSKLSLHKILELEDPFTIDQARWYLSLIYLKENNINKAKIYLEILAKDPAADKHGQAIKLLKEL